MPNVRYDTNEKEKMRLRLQGVMSREFTHLRALMEVMRTLCTIKCRISARYIITGRSQSVLSTETGRTPQRRNRGTEG